MKTPAWCLAVLLLVLSGHAHAGDGLKSGRGGLVLTNVTLIDGANALRHPEMTILIRGDTIAEVAKNGEFAYPDGFPVIDLEGKYLIPGLIDGHVHIRNLPDKQLEFTLRCRGPASSWRASPRGNSPRRTRCSNGAAGGRVKG